MGSSTASRTPSTWGNRSRSNRPGVSVSSGMTMLAGIHSTPFAAAGGIHDSQTRADSATSILHSLREGAGHLVADLPDVGRPLGLQDAVELLGNVFAKHLRQSHESVPRLLHDFDREQFPLVPTQHVAA